MPPLRSFPGDGRLVRGPLLGDARVTDELSLRQIYEYDQRHAAMIGVLDLAIAGYKGEIERVGEISAAHNFADAIKFLLGIGQVMEVIDLLVEAVARLAEQ